MRKPAELTNYRGYIKSAYWTQRKRLHILAHNYIGRSSVKSVDKLELYIFRMKSLYQCAR